MEIKHVSTKNLHECTAQEVFDFIANHLLTQGRKSIVIDDDGVINCVYMAPNGDKCAAGAIIDEGRYTKVLENLQWLELVAAAAVPSAHADLIGRLQTVHDISKEDKWPSKLEDLAYEKKLQWRFADL